MEIDDLLNEIGNLASQMIASARPAEPFRVVVADPPCLTPEWFAGFVDGEGSINIATHGGTGLQPRLVLKLRADDEPVLRSIRKWLGVGSVRHRNPAPKDPRGSNPQFCLNINGAHCARVVEILDTALLRTKKRYEYPVWRQAVAIYCSMPGGRWRLGVRRNRDALLWPLKRQLEALRVYR